MLVEISEFHSHIRNFISVENLHLILSTEVKRWTKTCLTASHCTLELGQRSRWSRFSDPSRPSVLENRLPYGNNLPPTLALFRSVTATDTSAASEGRSRTKVMNDRLMGNQTTCSRRLLHFSSPRMKINTKEKYSLRTQTRLPSDLQLFWSMFEISVVHVCWNHFLDKNQKWLQNCQRRLCHVVIGETYRRLSAAQ